MNPKTHADFFKAELMSFWEAKFARQADAVFGTSWAVYEGRLKRNNQPKNL